jgi:hypothetical protein
MTSAASRSGDGLPKPMLRCGKICGSVCNKNHSMLAMSAGSQSRARQGIWHGSLRTVLLLYYPLAISPAVPTALPGSPATWPTYGVGLDGQPHAWPLTRVPVSSFLNRPPWPREFVQDVHETTAANPPLAPRSELADGICAALKHGQLSRLAVSHRALLKKAPPTRPSEWIISIVSVRAPMRLQLRTPALQLCRHRSYTQDTDTIGSLWQCLHGIRA